MSKELWFLQIIGVIFSAIALYCTGSRWNRPGMAKARFGVLCALLGGICSLPIIFTAWQNYRANIRPEIVAHGAHIALMVIAVGFVANYILWRFAFPKREP